jgi:hypothetical protein
LITSILITAFVASLIAGVVPGQESDQADRAAAEDAVAREKAQYDAAKKKSAGPATPEVYFTKKKSAGPATPEVYPAKKKSTGPDDRREFDSFREADLRSGTGLSPSEAASQVGRRVTVEFMVRSTGSNPDGFLELYSERTWREEGAFFIRFPEDTQQKFEGLGIPDVRTHFAGKTVRVAGLVQAKTFQTGGTHPLIVVQDIRQIAIVHTATGTGASLYVLAIGINDYPDQRLRLDCAAPDARSLRQAFLKNSRRLFPGGVEARLLLDAQATRAGILKGLQWLEGKTRTGDVAVVFYAGHGDSMIEGQFYLVPVDANMRRLAATGISGETLRKTLGDLPSTTMLILDACDSGAIDPKKIKTRKTRALPSPTDTLLRQLVTDEGLVVMCGAAKGQEAAEENGHGFFTQAIVEGLAGQADVFKKGRVELYDLQAYDLQAYVKTRVGQLSGNEQEPTISIPSTVRSFALSKP